MKTNIFLFALVLLSSCVMDNDDLEKPPSTETGVIGTWQEYGPKSLHLDSMGNVIDSVDVNSRFQFFSDSSYIAENDIYTNSVKGTWSFDTNLLHIKIYPQGPLYNATSDHIWAIHKLDSSDLEVSHVYLLTLPNQSYNVLVQRNFKRIN